MDRLMLLRNLHSLRPCRSCANIFNGIAGENGAKQKVAAFCIASRDLGGCPVSRFNHGAHTVIRTRDLFLTKEVLYRLSYMSVNLNRSDNSGAGGGNRTRVISLEG